MRRALAVFAHPDDESFGLGGVLGALVDGGVQVSGLCFTHGEASTLGTGSVLGDVRSEELALAAAVLGLTECRLLDYPDGALAAVPLDLLTTHVVEDARRVQADVLVVFDDGGVTGHPDHQRATDAALAAADELDLAVLAWAVADDVAGALNAEFGTTFRGRGGEDIDRRIAVDRERQRAAVACHHSQATTNAVLWRRLELSGHSDPVRWLRSRSVLPVVRNASDA
ncbi:MAG TPA: PIG-L deacetylase family protein [Acidimicrobiia bacterium]|nr:PIG-L deacetylase family protein [Acidimicrobiia bacterium]